MSDFKNHLLFQTFSGKNTLLSLLYYFTLLLFLLLLFWGGLSIMFGLFFL